MTEPEPRSRAGRYNHLAEDPERGGSPVYAIPLSVALADLAMRRDLERLLVAIEDVGRDGAIDTTRTTSRVLAEVVEKLRRVYP